MNAQKASSTTMHWNTILDSNLNEGLFGSARSRPNNSTRPLSRRLMDLSLHLSDRQYRTVLIRPHFLSLDLLPCFHFSKAGIIAVSHSSFAAHLSGRKMTLTFERGRNIPSGWREAKPQIVNHRPSSVCSALISSLCLSLFLLLTCELKDLPLILEKRPRNTTLRAAIYNLLHNMRFHSVVICLTALICLFGLVGASVIEKRDACGNGVKVCGSG
jgi:hypothetical protein